MTIHPPALKQPLARATPEKKRKTLGVRLLVVEAKSLPEGLHDALLALPLQCIETNASLSGIQLKVSDVLLITEASHLTRLEQALRLRPKSKKLRPLVIGFLDTAHAPPKPSDWFELTCLKPEGSSALIARHILRRLKTGLIEKGILKRKTQSVQKSSSRAMSTKRRSRRPARPNSQTATALPALPILPTPNLKVPEAIPPPTQPLILPQLSAPNIEHQRSRASIPAARPSLMPPGLSIAGSNWVLLDDNVARAHAVATRLISAGATVELSGLTLSDTRYQALRKIDGAGILICESAARSSAPILKEFARDARLRWVPWVPIRWASIYNEQTSAVKLDALKLLLLPHWQPEHDISTALCGGEVVPLDRVGPAKALRALSATGSSGLLNVESGGQTWSLEVTEGRLNGCIADSAADPLLGHQDALRAMLDLREGTAHFSSGGAAESSKSGDLGDIRQLLDVLADSLERPGPDGTDSDLKQQKANKLEHQAANIADAGQAEAAANQDDSNAQLEHVWTRAQEHAKRGLLSLGPMATRLEQGWFKLPRMTRRVFAGGAVLVPLVLLASWMVRPGEKPAQASSAPILATTTAQAPVAEKVSPPTASAKTADNEAPAKTTEVASQNGYPRGCSRWLTAQQPGPRRRKQGKSAWLTARKAVQIGNSSRAEEFLCLSVAMDHLGPGALGLIRFHFSEGNLEGATAWAEWAVKHQPPSPQLKQALADVRNRQGRLDEARGLLHESLGVSAADARVIRQVARKYANDGFKTLNARDPGQADRLFRRASVLDPENALAKAGLAELALRHGKVNASLTLAQKAVELDARCFEAQLVLGDAYAEQSQTSAAKQAWLEAAGLRPRSRKARRRLGL